MKGSPPVKPISDVAKPPDAISSKAFGDLRSRQVNQPVIFWRRFYVAVVAG
jgi:hypothetical protein